MSFCHAAFGHPTRLGRSGQRPDERLEANGDAELIDLDLGRYPASSELPDAAMCGPSAARKRSLKVPASFPGFANARLKYLTWARSDSSHLNEIDLKGDSRAE